MIQKKRRKKRTKKKLIKKKLIKKSSWCRQAWWRWRWCISVWVPIHSSFFFGSSTMFSLENSSSSSITTQVNNYNKYCIKVVCTQINYKLYKLKSIIIKKQIRFCSFGVYKCTYILIFVLLSLLCNKWNDFFFRRKSGTLEKEKK